MERDDSSRQLGGALTTDVYPPDELACARVQTEGGELLRGPSREPLAVGVRLFDRRLVRREALLRRRARRGLIRASAKSLAAPLCRTHMNCCDEGEGDHHHELGSESARAQALSSGPKVKEKAIID